MVSSYRIIVCIIPKQYVNFINVFLLILINIIDYWSIIHSIDSRLTQKYSH